MNTTNYAGIDYGLGQSNRDKSNGIRNGVIPQNDVGEAWYDESEPFHGKPHCPKCGNEASEVKGNYDRYEHSKYGCDDHVCHGCKYVFGSEEAYGDEPVSHFYEQAGYSAECGESGDIFVCKSPFFTYAQFCSPCAPGACYLRNPLDLEACRADGQSFEQAFADNRAYCLGHDWFDGGVAPYPVYSVATGELVKPATT